MLGTVNIAWSILLLLFIVFFLAPVAWRMWLVLFLRTRIHENILFEWVSWVVFSVLFVLLAFHSFQLIVLWNQTRAIMKGVLRLPVVPALGRIPPRVANWFFASAKHDRGQFDLIQRQANALADLCTDQVRDEWQKRVPMYFEDDGKRWAELKTSLREVQLDLVKVLRLGILPLLMQHWNSIPLTSAYASGAPSGDDGAPARKDAEELRNIALALAQKPVPDVTTENKWLAWIRLAEDLAALSFLRWLASALAQIWILIGFLVLGSVSLLLAISSYPYPHQHRMMFGLGLLVAFLAVTIFRIVLGINREELISRISNTIPNRLKLDGQLMTNILTYVVPLVGALAAFSFDSSDTIRTLLDPILRPMR
jgi:hypothetical protein